MIGLKYYIDVTFCLDMSEGTKNHLNNFVEGFQKLGSDISYKLEKKDKRADQIRFKIITYGDLYQSNLKASKISNFKCNELETAIFKNQFLVIGKSNGLEALTLAIRSDWTKDGDRRRHIIVIASNKGSYKLEHLAASKPKGYPQDMPANFDELTDLWEGQSGINNIAKRLLLFAPDTYPWTDISNHWSNVIHFTSKSSDMLDFEELINSIVSSV